MYIYVVHCTIHVSGLYCSWTRAFARQFTFWSVISLFFSAI